MIIFFVGEVRIQPNSKNGENVFALKKLQPNS